MKTELRKIREDAIKDMVVNYGFKKSKRTYLVSFWGLADNLNNCWHAKNFLNQKLKEKYGEYTDYDDWAVPDYNHRLYRKPIRDTIRKMKGSKIYDGFPEWYLIYV